MQASRWTIRAVMAALLVAAGGLWALEQGTARMERELTLDPDDPNQVQLGHPYLLWGLPPGDTAVNGQLVHINSAGMRGPEVRSQKAAESRRIITVGGSIAFGEGVERHEIFSADAIAELGGSRVGLEDLNLAVPRYTALQTRNLMDMRGWRLEPDLLIIEGPGAEVSVGPYRDIDLLSVYRGRSETRKGLERFAIFRVLEHIVSIRRGPKADLRRSVFAGTASANPSGDARMSPPTYDEHLDALVQEARDRGVEVALVLTPNGGDISGDTPHALRPYREVMWNVARRHGAWVLDGPEVFRTSGRSLEDLFIDSTLLSPHGHRILSYALTRTLKTWVRGKPLRWHPPVRGAQDSSQGSNP